MIVQRFLILAALLGFWLRQHCLRMSRWYLIPIMLTMTLDSSKARPGPVMARSWKCPAPDR